MIASLKIRLLLALLLTILLNWAIWFVLQAVEMGRQQTGLWDAKLKDLAQTVLLSLPGPMSPPGDTPGYRLPERMTPHMDNTVFQVWHLTPGHGPVLRSPAAPVQPLQADFSLPPGYFDVSLDGEDWRIYTLNDHDGRIQVQAGHRHSQRLIEFSLWLNANLKEAALLFCLLTVATFYVLRRELRHIDRMGELMQRRDPFDLAPLPPPSRQMPRELHPLVESVNRLLSRLEKALARERHLLADAAHELRTPLAALITQAELAHDAPRAEDKDAALDKLLGVARRTARLSEQLLDQARFDALERAPEDPVDLAALVSVVVREHESAARAKQQRVRLDVQPCTVAGDLDALGTMTGNLVNNALRYTPAHGQIDVVCGSRGNGTVAISVTDDGPGVPAAERGRIFDRFYRVPGNGERGSGIGLSLVAQIARLHGARIECGPGPQGKGFRIEVIFPAPA